MNNARLNEFGNEKLNTMVLTPFTCNCIAALEFSLVRMVTEKLTKTLPENAITRWEPTKDLHAEGTEDLELATMAMLTVPLDLEGVLSIIEWDLLTITSSAIHTTQAVVEAMEDRCLMLGVKYPQFSIILNAIKFDSVNGCVYVPYLLTENKEANGTRRSEI